MLKNLDSEFVIRLVDAYEGRSEVILVTEYLAGGELFERVVDEDFDLTESHCVLQGGFNCCSLAAGLRGNGEFERK